MVFTKIFLMFIEISIFASIIGCCAVILRVIAGKKSGTAKQSWIWYIFTLKLICIFIPFIGYNIFSIADLVERPADNILSGNENIVEPMLEQNEFESVPVIETGDSLSIVDYLAIVWLVVVVLLLIYQIICRYKLTRELKRTRAVDSKEITDTFKDLCLEMKITRKIQLLESDFFQAPVITGILRPSVILPFKIEEQYSKQEIKIMITHELCHYKRKDLVMYKFMALIKAFYFFNPFIIYFIHQMKNDFEIACDFRTLKYIDNSSGIAYGNCLIKNIEQSSSFFVKNTSAGCSSGKKFMKRRIIMVKNYSNRKTLYSAFTFVFIGLASVLLMTGVSKNNIVDETESVFSNWPVSATYYVTLKFGEQIHPFTRKSFFHSGVDVAAKEGSLITAAAEGTVAEIGNNSKLGKYVVLKHADGYSSHYLHCKSIGVEKNQKINAGEKIAELGNTGKSTGAHLHFEIRLNDKAVNPAGFFNSECSR